MSELASYSIQATILAVIALIAVSRSKKTELYQVVLISIWLVGVIAIYARYGEGQDLFYSNDQQFHRQVLEYYIPNEGFRLSGVIALRYLITFPVYLISLTGLNPLLVNKFFQLVALLSIYKISQNFLRQQNIKAAYWQLPFIAGPILIFMSLLSLRDVALAYFSLLFVTSKQLPMKLTGVIGAALLRPHLGVALLVGYCITLLIDLTRKRLGAMQTLCIGLLTHVAGTTAYWLGAAYRQGTKFEFQSSIFTQFKFSQMAANFLGLQFLGLNDPEDGLVAASTLQLLASRVVFFETILIPILFLASMFRHPDYLTKQKMLTFQAFLFFYGVVSQTTWNSTRQNIPFLACMGVLAVADIEYFRNLKRNRQPQLLSTSN